MKPNWKNAPEWANYLAMDYDRRWYWYESLPEFFFEAWSSRGGRWDVARCTKDKSERWPKDSLEKRQ